MDRHNIYFSFFNQLGYNTTAILTPVELLTALETLSSTPYNEDIASQLLERIPNSSFSFLLTDFLTVLIEAEDILSEKINRASALIDEYMNQKQIFQEKLRGIRTNETYNPLGVNLENNLVIEVNEVLNPSKIEHFFFILINCGGQRFKTKGFKGGRVNEAFNGSIEHGTENIYVKLVALRPQGEEIIGEQMVHISEITDQLKHDFTLSLLSENGIETPYRLNLSIQWIHSKVSYYEQIIDKLEKEVEILVTDRNDYELDLEWLILPFNKTVKHHSKPQIYNNYNSNQPIQIQIPDSLLISQGTREGMFMATNQGDNNLKRSKVFKQENELKESAFSDHNREKNVKDVKRDYFLIATMILTSFYAIFAILSCYMRSNFLDLFIAFSFIAILVSNFFEKWKMKTLIFLMVFSVFVDLPWLIIYTNNWWDQTYYVESNQDENGIIRLSVVMSYFTLVSKIFLTGFYWKLGNKVEKMNDELSFFFKPTEINGNF